MQLRTLTNAGIAIMLLAFTSCKKETVKDPSPAAPAAKTLAKLSDVYSTYFYEYNTDKSIKSYSWANGAGKTVFEYQSGKVITTTYNGGAKKFQMVYTLVNGFAQKANAEAYDAGGNVTDTYESIFTYNAQGKMAKATYTKNGVGAGYDEYTYNADGNATSYKSVDKNGAVYWEAVYEYDMTLDDKSGAVGQFASGTGDLFPKYSTKLLKKRTITNSTGTTVYNITRTLDAQGYELTVTNSNMTAGTAETLTYTWQ